MAEIRAPRGGLPPEVRSALYDRVLDELREAAARGAAPESLMATAARVLREAERPAVDALPDPADRAVPGPEASRPSC